MPPPQSSLLRSLGLLTGDLLKSVTGHRPAYTEKKVISRDVQEQQVQTPSGPVTLRRTTIDEVELPPHKP